MLCLIAFYFIIGGVSIYEKNWGMALYWSGAILLNFGILAMK